MPAQSGGGFPPPVRTTPLPRGIPPCGHHRPLAAKAELARPAGPAGHRRQPDDRAVPSWLRVGPHARPSGRERESPRPARRAGRSPAIGKQIDGNLLDCLLSCEVDLGLSEQVAEHWRSAQKCSFQARGRRLRIVFPKQPEVAEVLWRGLRAESPDEKPAATLRRLQGLLAVPPMAAGLEALRKVARRAEQETPAADRTARARLCLALATFFQDRGDRDVAILYARKAASRLSVTEQLQVRRRLAAAERWSYTARAYRAVYQHDEYNAAALYLLGRANVRLGRKEEGQKQMDLGCSCR